jgi:hypothetical protein
MNNQDHISESLETIFWVKILRFFDAHPRSGMEKIWIRNNGLIRAKWPEIMGGQVMTTMRVNFKAFQCLLENVETKVTRMFDLPFCLLYFFKILIEVPK